MLILKALLVWVVMWLTTTNLVGFALRGFFYMPPAVDAPTDRVTELLATETNRMASGSRIMALFATVGLLVLLWALYRYWNLWLVAAAGLIIIARLPDLFWEIRTGRRVTRSDAPAGLVYRFSPVLLLGSLPLVWYALSIGSTSLQV